MDNTETTKTPDTQEVAPEAEKQDVKSAENEKPDSSCKSAKTGKKEDERKRLREENEKLKHELSDLDDVYRRMLAEYSNYKRRTEQEKEQLGNYVKSETLKSLLPVLDNLERAVNAPPGDEYKTGIEMIIRQLAELLTAQGLDTINPLGEVFNPEIHHAVMRVDAEGVEPDTVTQVFQKGYRLGERLLRPAMVKVAN
ncbi:MAG: nucleotide exchange factor GrpE [Oscillospiraceae bacterium]|nr:nucleotide exchange factor GrpE [Oscillospiraceae bacterium]MDD4413740.1 nucleotide exchange factor GrpE [Oscillospiraceae bacterium]